MSKIIKYIIHIVFSVLICISAFGEEISISTDTIFYDEHKMDSLVEYYVKTITEKEIKFQRENQDDKLFFIDLLNQGSVTTCDFSTVSPVLNTELNSLYNTLPRNFSYYVLTANYNGFEALINEHAYDIALRDYMNSTQITVASLKSFRENIVSKIVNKFTNDLLLQLNYSNDDTYVILDLIIITKGLCPGNESSTFCFNYADIFIYFDQRIPEDFKSDFNARFEAATTSFSRDTRKHPGIAVQAQAVCNMVIEGVRAKMKILTEIKASNANNLDAYLSELQTTNDPLRVIEIINRLYTDEILEIDQELRLRLVTILSKINLTEANRGEQAVLKLLINTDLNQQAGFMLAGIKQNHILERLIYVVDDNASFSSGLYNPNYTKIIFALYAYALVLDQRLVQNDAYQLIQNNKTFLWEGDGITTFPGYSIKFNTAGNGLIVTYTNGTNINLDLFEPIGIISSVPLPAYNSQSAGSYYDIVVPAIYLQWLLQKKDMRNISQAGEVGIQVLSVVSGTGALLTTTSRVIRVLSVVEIASGLAGLAVNLTDLRTVIHQKYGEPGAAFVDNILFITNTISLFGAGTSLLNLETKLDNAIEFWMAKRNTIKVDVFADDLATYNQLDNLLKRQGDDVVDIGTNVTRHANWVEITDIRYKINDKVDHVIENLDINPTGTKFTGCHSEISLRNYIAANPASRYEFRNVSYDINSGIDEASRVFEANPVIIKEDGFEMVKSNNQGVSSFFPENWDKNKILDEVEYAIANNHGRDLTSRNPNELYGFSKDGKVEIHFYYNPDGSIGSYFPKKR